MNLIQLECFCAAVDIGNFTQAARVLHVTQPALSRMIYRLEEDLGCKLFDRMGKSVSLNDCGRIVYRNARAIFLNETQMRQEILDLQNQVSGSIILGSAIPKREQAMYEDVLLKFVDEYPDVSLQVIPFKPQDVLSALVNGSIDLAITTEEISHPGVEWVPLFSDRVGVELSKNHPLAARSVLSVAELENEFFVCGMEYDDVFNLTHAYCLRAGFKPKLLFSGDFSRITSHLISEGRAISFMQEASFRNKDENEPILNTLSPTIFRCLSDEYAVCHYGMASLKTRYNPLAVQKFRSMLLDKLKDAPQRGDKS